VVEDGQARKVNVANMKTLLLCLALGAGALLGTQPLSAAHAAASAARASTTVRPLQSPTAKPKPKLVVTQAYVAPLWTCGPHRARKCHH